MRTISQRELRNDNAAVVRAVEAGESYTVTRRGVPVARLVPLTDEPELQCARPATRRPQFAGIPRVQITSRSADLLDDVRGDR